MLGRNCSGLLSDLKSEMLVRLSSGYFVRGLVARAMHEEDVIAEFYVDTDTRQKESMNRRVEREVTRSSDKSQKRKSWEAPTSSKLICQASDIS